MRRPCLDPQVWLNIWGLSLWSEILECTWAWLNRCVFFVSLLAQGSHALIQAEQSRWLSELRLHQPNT